MTSTKLRRVASARPLATFQLRTNPGLLFAFVGNPTRSRGRGRERPPKPVLIFPEQLIPLGLREPQLLLVPETVLLFSFCSRSVAKSKAKKHSCAFFWALLAVRLWAAQASSRQLWAVLST